MRNHFCLVKPIFLTLLLILSAAVQANTLTASVDRNSIGLQETLSLIVSADEQSQEAPDFSTLNNDFDVLSSSKSQSIKVINGSTESNTEWHLTLAPKRTGTLLIPSFNLDDAISDAIEIQVSDQAPTQSASSDEPVQVIAEISKRTVLVQEQILLKIKLITRVNLNQAELQTLELKNAVVVSLDQQQFQTTIGGKPHLVVETNYAIFPQESGEFIIPRLTYSVAVDSMRDPWGDPFGRNRNNILRLRTDEQRIDVKPAPQNLGKAWQPANRLMLNEGWSGNVDQLKVGEPITRTITVTADGLTGGQLAPVAMPGVGSMPGVDGLTLYPDQAQTKDNKNSKGVQGTRTETVAIVPNRSGTFILPEVRVDWWDTNTQSMQTATLAAKTLNVTGDANIQAPLQQPETGQKNNIADPAEVITTTSTPYWLWITNSIFMLLSLFLAFYILKLKSKMKEMENLQEQANEAISEREKDIWDLLKHAAATKDAATLRKGILQWAKFQWPEQQAHSLDEIAKLIQKPELTQALSQLDKILYSNHPTSEWDAQRILKLLNESRKEKKTKKEAVTLQPLYRD